MYARGTLINFYCCCLVNLPFVTLICMAPVGEPKMGGGKRFFFPPLQTWPMNEDNLGFAGKVQEKEGIVPHKCAIQTT